MKPLLDGLPHDVEVERLRLAVRVLAPEDLQRLVFRRGGEGEEAEVRLLAALGHRLQDFFLVVGAVPWLRPSSLAFSLIAVAGQHPLQFGGGLAGLRAVGLVHDHRVLAGPAASPTFSVTNGNFCSVVMMIGTPDFSASASCVESSSIFWTTPLLVLELVDRVLQLLVEHAAVGDDDDGVEDLLVLRVVQAGRAGAPARRWCCSCRCRPSA